MWAPTLYPRDRGDSKYSSPPEKSVRHPTIANGDEGYHFTLFNSSDDKDLFDSQELPAGAKWLALALGITNIHSAAIQTKKCLIGDSDRELKGLAGHLVTASELAEDSNISTVYALPYQIGHTIKALLSDPETWTQGGKIVKEGFIIGCKWLFLLGSIQRLTNRAGITTSNIPSNILNATNSTVLDATLATNGTLPGLPLGNSTLVEPSDFLGNAEFFSSIITDLISKVPEKTLGTVFTAAGIASFCLKSLPTLCLLSAAKNSRELATNLRADGENAPHFEKQVIAQKVLLTYLATIYMIRSIDPFELSLKTHCITAGVLDSLAFIGYQIAKMAFEPLNDPEDRAALVEKLKNYAQKGLRYGVDFGFLALGGLGTLSSLATSIGLFSKPQPDSIRGLAEIPGNVFLSVAAPVASNIVHHPILTAQSLTAALLLLCVGSNIRKNGGKFDESLLKTKDDQYNTQLLLNTMGLLAVIFPNYVYDFAKYLLLTHPIFTLSTGIGGYLTTSAIKDFQEENHPPMLKKLGGVAGLVALNFIDFEGMKNQMVESVTSVDYTSLGGLASAGGTLLKTTSQRIFGMASWALSPLVGMAPKLMREWVGTTPGLIILGSGAASAFVSSIANLTQKKYKKAAAHGAFAVALAAIATANMSSTTFNNFNKMLGLGDPTPAS